MKIVFNIFWIVILVLNAILYWYKAYTKEPINYLNAAFISSLIFLCIAEAIFDIIKRGVE